MSQNPAKLNGSLNDISSGQSGSKVAKKFSFGFQINLCLTFNALYLTGIGHLTLGLNLVVSRAR